MAMDGNVEVKDSQKGYFIPVHYGLGLLPDGRVVGRRRRRRRRRHLEIQIDMLGGELYSEFFIWIWGRGERYLRMKSGVRVEFRYKAYERSGLAWGAILGKVHVLSLFPKLPCSFFQEHVPKMDSFANVLDSKELLSISRITSY